MNIIHHFRGKINKMTSENEKAIQEQIRELEGSSGAVIVLVILGIVGIFFFLIPGIILFVAAAIVSSSRKSRAASLRAQLESIKHKTTESLGREQPLEILKKQFVEGKIDKKTNLEKKQVLEK